MYVMHMPRVIFKKICCEAEAQYVLEHVVLPAGLQAAAYATIMVPKITLQRDIVKNA